MSITTDITSSCFAFPELDEGRLKKVRVFHKYYLPELNIDELARAARAPYRLWVEQGWLTLTPGNTVDYEVVKEDIRWVRDRFTLPLVGFDPYNASQITNDLQDQDGIKIEWIGQGPKSLGTATKETERLILRGDLVHEMNPITRLHMSNVQIVYDRSGNPKPIKSDGGRGASQKKRYKIDGAIAMILAVWLAVTHTRAKESVYRKRGIRSIGGPGGGRRVRGVPA